MIRPNRQLKPSGAAMKIIELEEVDSTNEYCKRVDCGEDLIVTAKKQILGKGTKGRSFASNNGGLYISVMKHYSDFPSSRTFEIMINSCVAVCKTLTEFGVNPVIRWANDVLVNGLKISGTLIENSFSGEKIMRSIVGIGVNVNNILPPELDGIATSLGKISGKIIGLESFKTAIISNLKKEFTVSDYKSYMPWLGGEATLSISNDVVNVRTIDVSDDGRLVVDIDGKVEKISAAEVSLRL